MISNHMKDKNVMRDCEFEFMNRRPYLTNLIVFYEMTGSAEKGKAVDIDYLDFSMINDLPWPISNYCLKYTDMWSFF